MNTDTLKCFILVAENLSFARAAEALYISQPAVTKQIRSLENELGTELFIRSTRHVELTPEGMSFYKDARDIVHKTESAVSRIRLSAPGAQAFRIGLSSPTALNVLTPFLTDFHKENPDIIPSIEVLSYKVIMNLFMENKLDLMFYYRENMTKSSGIKFAELREDHYVCLMPEGHRLSGESELTVEAVSSEKLIACNPLNAPLSIADFQQRMLKDHPLKDVIYCNTVEIAHCMVSTGMGIAVLPSALCPDGAGFRTVPLKCDERLSLGCFYHTKNKNRSLHQFLRLISEDQEES